MRNPLARLVQRDPAKPTLRQRATLLKASAARLIRRPVAPGVALDPGPEPDRISPQDAELLRLERAWIEARAQEEASYARQAQIAATSPKLGPPPEDMDAWRAWYAKGCEWRDASGMEAEEEEGKRLCGVVDDLARQMSAVPARTLVGLRVKARLVSGFASMNVEPVEGLVEGLASDLLTVNSDVLDPNHADRDAPDADADLIALGRQFEEAYAAWQALLPIWAEAETRVEAFKKRALAQGLVSRLAETAAWLQDGVQEAHDQELEAYEALEPLNVAIMGAPAHTLAGLAVKARAATTAFWPKGNFEKDRDLGADEDWKERTARDLIEACITLGQREQAGSLPACRAATPADRGETKPGIPDLSALSVSHLSNLYDRLAAAADSWNNAAHLPWANEWERGGLRHLNAAGDIMDAEQERAAALRDAVAAEVERRPASPNDGDHDSRLEVLIRHELLCNGNLRSAPALRAAVAQTWGA